MLKETLEHIIPFDDDTLNRLVNQFSEVEWEKGEVFAKKGEYSRNIAFVKSGVLRAFYSNDKGEEYNKTFFTEKYFVGAYSSLVTGERNSIGKDLGVHLVVRLCIAFVAFRRFLLAHG